jgi:hypothetical protein
VNAATVNTTTAAVSATADYGDPSVGLSASVTPASGPAVNVGTVTFTIKSGATTIGTVTSGTVTGGSAGATFPLSGINAGLYSIEASYDAGTGFNSSNNAAQTPVPTLTVNKAPLVVTPGDHSKMYGETFTAFTGTLATLVAGDNITATYASTGAAANAAVGTFPILATLVDPASRLGNYDVTLNEGTLTVTKAPLVVTPASGSKIYGETFTAFTGTLATVVAGDVITATYASTGAAPGAPVGAHSIVAMLEDLGGRLGNYNVTLNTGTLTVLPKALSITAHNALKILGATLTFAGTEFTASGLVNLDTVTSVTLSSAGTAPGAGVGPYEILANDAIGTGLTNYTITYFKGTLNVVFGWTGFLQPINDTAHQTGLTQSKFKLGQTIPAKFVIMDAFGNAVQQAGNPFFTRSPKIRECAEGTLEVAPPDLNPTADPTYKWDGAQYHYNWSTKGLGAPGVYRIFANLADGTSRFVDICLTK